MKMPAIRLFSVIIFIFPTTAYSVEPSAGKSAELQFKEYALLLNQFQESLEVETSDSAQLTSWPLVRPSSATKVLRVESFSYSYDLYMWWDEGYLFGQAVPLNNTVAFVCGVGWLFVQDFGDFVSGFDTSRFDDSDGNSICDSFIFPKIFHITQWSFMSTKVDFSKPFNFINSDDASSLVAVGGGVVSGQSDASPSLTAGVVKPNLDISISSIEYQALTGSEDIWLELEFTGADEEGQMTWRFSDGGFNN